MSEQNIGTTTDAKDLVTIVQERLKALGSQKSLDPLKDLFWKDLEYTRVSKSLPYQYGWSSAIRQTLYEGDPILHLASGGRDNDFDILYIRMKSNTLFLSEERPIVMELLKSHLDALFIFSNASQDHWHFVNVKQDAQDAKRRLFRRITVGPEERLRTASERLAKLELVTRGDASRLDIRLWHDDAFNVEEVTRRFFDEYKTLFRTLQIDLNNQTHDLVWAHDYALQFLNRCMFLYFIQRKGWLGGDREFLHSFWESYAKVPHEQNSFFESWLKVLFFEAFNNRFHGGYTYFPQAIHTILAMAPYLNGGLFAQNDLDTQHSFLITDERFGQVLTFFDKFNFTISEDSPLDQEVAVDPEMIGRVYESLVNVSTELDERGDAGIFYTPRTEIDLMCRLTVVDYLNNHLNELDEHVKPALYDMVFALETHEKSAADDAFKTFNLWDQLNTHLQGIAVLDPACGSGSFLVGMLHVLDDLQDRVNQQRKVDENPYRRKKRIIGQSLYGVDAMGWAVHIAELRLWLTLIVDADITPDSDMASEEKRHVRPDPLLPHLSFKIRQGDSLVQELGSLNMHRKRLITDLPRTISSSMNTLKRDKWNYYHGYATANSKTKETIERDEFRLFCDILDERIHRKDEEIKMHRHVIEDLQGERSLFESGQVNSKQNQATIAEREKLIATTERELQELQQARAKLTTPKDVPFVWDIAFVEVTDTPKSGFDIVIGNPPYVRQEQIASPRLSQHEALSTSSKGEYKSKLARSVYQAFPDFFGYTEGNITAKRKLDAKSDLYIYFYLHGLSLLNAKGSFCFITSNSWLDVGYGADLQEFLLRYCRVKMILDNQSKRSFATAAVNTVITLFSAPTTIPDEAALTNIMRFVMFKVTFEHILAADVFRKLEQIEERTDTPEYRVYPITQKSLLQDGYSYATASSEDTPQRRTGKGAAVTAIKEGQASYSANKWGGKYLRAPDIYWTIVEKGRDKLVRLGDIAEVKRGITTGANEFFYLDEAKARQWGIEEQFLRLVIKSPKECRSILIDPSILKSKLFVCHKSKEELKGTSALAYIKWGETQGYNKRPSCAGRIKWWDLGIRIAPHLGFNYLIDSTARTLYASDECFFSDNFQEVHIASQTILPLCVSLNSTIFQLMVNVAGRANFGDGLLKIQTYEVSDLLCVKPTNIKVQNSNIFAASSWDVLHPSSERRSLDSIVFDALKLTQGERDAVYEAVKELVGTRLDKAKSLKETEGRSKRMEAVEKTQGIWVGLPENILEDEVESHYA